MTLLAFNSQTRNFEPVLVKQLGSTVSDGSETLIYTMLAAPHDAGTYIFGVQIEVTVAASAGVCEVFLSDGVNMVSMWAPQSLTNTGLLTLPNYTRRSDGASNIQLIVGFEGVTGSPEMVIRTVVL